MSEESSPILDVDLGANGGRRVYRTMAELEEWFNSENALWDWLRQTNWDANALTGGSSYFSDSKWTNHHARFYRFRAP